jgi:aspartyl-tRNA synthetase
MVFIDLRDRWGLVQVVARPEFEDALARAKEIRPEFVLSIRGEVKERPKDMANPEQRLGKLEVWAEEIHVLSEAAALPFVLVEGAEVSDLTRMKYRYLDMRRTEVTEALVFRHRAAHFSRNFLVDRGFVEVETPQLTKSTPEGARDYLVPSRVHPRACYALPQSPQLFKQLLMIAGFDRYYQIARCFRDEDQRADRQPEFTQIDIEMSFVGPEDVIGLAEDLTAELFRDLLGIEIPRPVERMGYDEALDRFGTDKPDRRFGCEIADVTDIVADCGFRVFSSQAKEGGAVRGFCLPGAASYSRRQISLLEDVGREAGLGGLVSFKAEAEGLRSSLNKFFEDETLSRLAEALGARPGDLVLLAAGPARQVSRGLGAVRLGAGRDLGLVPSDRFALLWVVDHPLLEADEEEGHLAPVHHPFTMPVPSDFPLLDTDPGRVRAQSYDLVLNGHEIAGGSIRIHREDLQQKVFEAIGLDRETAEAKFGFLLEAFRYGAPPHGGIAFGFDRLVALLRGTETIRDVIAFPKTTRAFCPLTGAPGRVGPELLAPLRLAWEAEEEAERVDPAP